MKTELTPRIADLQLECVLVQAWKKTGAYIRQHNWYADTLELDYTALRLPTFLLEIKQRLDGLPWEPTPLSVVPAPKSHRWQLKNGQEWAPEPGVGKKLRPLAHVAIPDQVLATAILLCLADRVETLQGDPRLSAKRPINRPRVLSYGHRLFCDSLLDSRLWHRWGSRKLYRQHFDDYRAFLERPTVVVEELKQKGTSPGFEIAVVSSDLSRFYDRVRPALLSEKVRKLRKEGDDDTFLSIADQLFNWSWTDSQWAERYAATHGIDGGFQRVALPQGLVASGFLANIVLADFDDRLRKTFDRPISEAPSILLCDACRYVDDMRMVLLVQQGIEEGKVEQLVTSWLNGLLQDTAPGLVVEPEKTSATIEGRERLFLVRQSRTANRIQREVSGTFDMLQGTELIGAIEGFFHTQQHYSSRQRSPVTGGSGFLVGRSDLRDDTAARFAAGRFRRTFRSLRPLLEDESQIVEAVDNEEEESAEYSQLPRLVLSKQQLDERARLFSAMLIEEWVADPAHLRLLRIALDLYPDNEFLDRILRLLRPGWQIGGWRTARRDIATFCLAEIFRAGATETGIVSDDECLPSGIDVAKYHRRLSTEARAVVAEYMAHSTSKKHMPWYLLQQVCLYLAARKDEEGLREFSQLKKARLGLHCAFGRFLLGQPTRRVEQRSIFTVLAFSAFGQEEILSEIANAGASPQFIRHLGDTSPQVALELWKQLAPTATAAQKGAARTSGLELAAPGSKSIALPSLGASKPNPFWNEENLVKLAFECLKQRPSLAADVLTPWQIQCKVTPAPEGELGFARIEDVTLNLTPARGLSFFTPPSWCDEDERRCYELGAILRFALRGSIDFFSSKRRTPKTDLMQYRPPTCHWELFRYGAFQGRSAFCPDWSPISSWSENLLLNLLRWPGLAGSQNSWKMDRVRLEVTKRADLLKAISLHSPGVLFLDLFAPWPGKVPNGPWQRPLRVGVVQSVIPSARDYGDHQNDPRFSQDLSFRRRHRRHLAAIIEGVSQMLRIRETHRGQSREDGRVIDLLVFPELAVQPDDIGPFIMPFVRSHRCMILMGLVYHQEPQLPGLPLVNSALWIVPEWTPTAGFQIKRFQQGKLHLTQEERLLHPPPVPFRPVQWIVNYDWASDQVRPLKLTGSVCYDSTDLKLVSNLRNRTDLYATCALNQDVGTFDRMVESLHYHMYQAVLIVNNGEYGGSCFYAPLRQPHQRQVLHIHGQPQAQIAFIEIAPRKILERPGGDREMLPIGEWKRPPAGWSQP